MFLETSQDLFLLVASICLIVVSGFLCWLLYEAARFFNQTNALVENIRTKVKMVEDSVIALSEKVSNISQYMGLLRKPVKRSWVTWIIKKKKLNGLLAKLREKNLLWMRLRKRSRNDQINA
jgi:hypothetical protein